MNYGFLIFLLISMSFSSLFTLPIHGDSSGVYISEIQFDGSTLNENDKWIELHNPTNQVVPLLDYSLRLNNNHRISLFSLTIQPGEYIVIVNNLSTKPSLVQKPDMSANLSYMSNTTSTKYISASLTHKNQILSTFVKDNSETNALLGTKTRKYSLEFDSNGAYQPSTNLYYGKADFGSPRLANSIENVSLQPEKISQPSQIMATMSPQLPITPLPVSKSIVPNPIEIKPQPLQSPQLQLGLVSQPSNQISANISSALIFTPNISESFKIPLITQSPTIPNFQIIESITLNPSLEMPFIQPLLVIAPLLLQNTAQWFGKRKPSVV